jgi:hypothetical protein
MTMAIAAAEKLRMSIAATQPVDRMRRNWLLDPGKTLRSPLATVSQNLSRGLP